MNQFNQLKKKLYRENSGMEERVAHELERMEISDKLRTARKSTRMTQKQVAEKMHVQSAYISQLENGNQNITITTLLKYTEAIGAELSVQVLGPRKLAGRELPCVAEEPDTEYKTKNG